MGLKEKRIEKNMTQEEVARKSDISLRTYQNIERRNDTTLRNAKKISEVLEESIENIFFK